MVMLINGCPLSATTSVGSPALPGSCCEHGLGDSKIILDQNQFVVEDIKWQALAFTKES